MLVVFEAATHLFASPRQNAEIFLSLPLCQPRYRAGQGRRVVSSNSCGRAAGVFVVFGLVDLFRQKRRKYTKGLRMSKQEVSRRSQGHGKAIRTSSGKNQALAPRSGSPPHHIDPKEVPGTATAVIVNPTALRGGDLKYRHDFDSNTPVVVAKGKKLPGAARIRQIALENNVPLVQENPPLAQALYKSVEVGREIPPQLFRAVAEVLAYIYKLTNARPPTEAAPLKIPGRGGPGSATPLQLFQHAVPRILKSREFEKRLLRRTPQREKPTFPVIDESVSLMVNWLSPFFLRRFAPRSQLHRDCDDIRRPTESEPPNPIAKSPAPTPA